MKKKLIIYKVFIIGIVLSLATSCLKDEENLYDFSDVTPVIELPQKPNGTTGMLATSVMQSAASEVKLLVNLAAPNAASQTLAVTLKYDTVGVGQILSKNANYILLDKSLLSSTTWQTTIKAGQNIDTFAIMLNTANFVFGKTYCLPVKIDQVPAGYVIPQQVFSAKFIGMVLKNAYEGSYKSTGSFVHPTAGARALDANKKLSSVDASTSHTLHSDLGGSGYEMDLKVTTDAITVNGKEAFKVTITQTAGGAAVGGAMQIDLEDGIVYNYYVPSEKKFVLRYQYNSSAPRKVWETLTML